jgi:hypothetical protein
MQSWNDDALSAYVDKQLLTADEQRRIEEQLSSGSETAQQIAVLRAVKNSIKSNANLRMEAPSALHSSILNSIRAEASQTSSQNTRQIVSAPKLGLLQRVLGWILQPIVAFPLLIIAVGGGYLLNSQRQNQIATANQWDFHDESFTNYDLITKGQLKVQKATSDYNELLAFFKEQGVNYDIVHPELKAQLVGGVVSEHNGQKLAHLVYKYHDSLVYMYEAPEHLFASHTLEIPSRVTSYAQSGRWYSEDDSQHSWMFWRVKTTYCSVVADIPKEELAELFVEGA